MSRVRTLLIAPAIFIGAIAISTVLLPHPALAQCSKADQCDPSECRERHDLVDQYCKHKTRSCRKVKASDKNTLALYIERNKDCLAARQYVALCFKTTDENHRKEIVAAQSALDTCETKFNQK